MSGPMGIMGPMPTTEGERKRLRFTPREAFRLDVDNLARATGRTPDDITREAAELGLPLLRAKLVKAARELSGATRGRKA
jgi:hypothetical protein